MENAVIKTLPLLKVILLINVSHNKVSSLIVQFILKKKLNALNVIMISI